MEPVRQPIHLQVLVHLPTDFFHCAHCERLFDAADVGVALHQELRADYPVDMLDEAAQLLSWLHELAARYGERLQIRVLDPQSPQGLVQSLLHRVRRYPAFIVNHRIVCAGWEPAALERLLIECSGGDLPAATVREISAWASIWERAREELRRAGRAAVEVVFGATTYEWCRGLRQERAEVEQLFVLITFGDIVGIPILPPYYTLRLLPYIVPLINCWKRSLLRERDWSDLACLIEGIG